MGEGRGQTKLIRLGGEKGTHHVKKIKLIERPTVATPRAWAKRQTKGGLSKQTPFRGDSRKKTLTTKKNKPGVFTPRFTLVKGGGGYSGGGGGGGKLF